MADVTKAEPPASYPPEPGCYTAQATDVRKSKIEQFLASADVRPDGDRPWDIACTCDPCFKCHLREAPLVPRGPRGDSVSMRGSSRG